MNWAKVSQNTADDYNTNIIAKEIELDYIVKCSNQIFWYQIVYE